MAAVDDPMKQLVIHKNSNDMMESYNYMNVTVENLKKEKEKKEKEKEKENKYITKMRQERNRKRAIEKVKRNREEFLHDRQNNLYILAMAHNAHTIRWIWHHTMYELPKMQMKDDYDELARSIYLEYDTELRYQNPNMFILNESIIEYMFFIILASIRYRKKHKIDTKPYIDYNVIIDELIRISAFTKVKHPKEAADVHGWSPNLNEITNILKEKNRLDDLLAGEISKIELEAIIDYKFELI